MFGNKLKQIIGKGKDENVIKQGSSEKEDVPKVKTKEENKSKRQIENLVFFIIILIVTVIIINTIWKGDSGTSTKQQTNYSNKTLASTSQENSTTTTSDDLEQRLEQVLVKIQGVQDAKVLINYSESIETVAMCNETNKTSETEETDTSGGVRTITETNSQKEVVYKEENGVKIPITQKTISPKPEGAIVTIKGNNNSTVKTNVIQAVEAVTGLATHKIQVFEMN